MEIGATINEDVSVEIDEEALEEWVKDAVVEYLNREDVAKSMAKDVIADAVRDAVNDFFANDENVKLTLKHVVWNDILTEEARQAVHDLSNTDDVVVDTIIADMRKDMYILRLAYDQYEYYKVYCEKADMSYDKLSRIRNKFREVAKGILDRYDQHLQDKHFGGKTDGKGNDS